MSALGGVLAAAAGRLDPPEQRIATLAASMAPEHRRMAALNMGAALDAEATGAALSPGGRMARAMVRTLDLSERAGGRPALPPACGAVYLAEPLAEPLAMCGCGLLIPGRRDAGPCLARCPDCGRRT